MASVKSCVKTFCPKFVVRQKKTLKKMTNSFSKIFKTKLNKSHKPSNSVLEKNLLKGCIKGYCNPTCKGTLFESGKGFPKSLEKEYKKKSPIVMNFIKATRKNIFKNKDNVLNNGFYNKLNNNSVKSIKKNGAISACSLKVL
jgi:hypothetical protein